jgi:hypothetical protein
VREKSRLRRYSASWAPADFARRTGLAVARFLVLFVATLSLPRGPGV